MSESDLRQAAEGLLAEYVRRLDDRDFEAWLALFRADAVYTVIRHDDEQRHTGLVLVGEGPDRLKLRIQNGRMVDMEPRTHLISGVRAEADGDSVKATANFAVIHRGRVTFAGRYHVSLVAEAGGLRIARMRAVIGNEAVEDLFQLPV